MIAKIKHHLTYQYSEAVYLEPHVLYVHPRKSSLLTVTEFSLRIQPEPVQISKNLDPEGNIQNILFFKEPTDHLSIQVHALVETTEFNPFDFVYFPFESKTLPMAYSNSYQKTLSPYLGLEGVTPNVEQMARQIASGVRYSTSAYLSALNEFIFKGCAILSDVNVGHIVILVQSHQQLGEALWIDLPLHIGQWQPTVLHFPCA